MDENELEKQSFSYKDKSPGGCYAMYTAMSHLYDYSLKPHVVTKSFARTYSKDATFSSGNYILYVVVADKLYTSADDVRDMISFAAAGNQLFIAANEADSALLEQLSITTKPFGLFADKVANQHYVNSYLAPDTAFKREGIKGGSYVATMDTSRTTILGTDDLRRPNFVKIEVGNGDVFLLLQPSSLTNYFLMHQRNIVSLERELSYTSYYIDHLYWDEFYKYQRTRQSSDFSEWQVLMRYPAMRWALWLIVLLLLLYVFFESKRRQRIIPEKQLLTNNSLEFVDALGQLYYQQHDNRNLAHKIVLQWLEFVRTRYYLNTNVLDNIFAEALSRKAGMPVEQVKAIIQHISEVQLAYSVSDQELQLFYKNIQAFYLNTK